MTREDVERAAKHAREYEKLWGNVVLTDRQSVESMLNRADEVARQSMPLALRCQELQRRLDAIVGRANALDPFDPGRVAVFQADIRWIAQDSKELTDV